MKNKCPRLMIAGTHSGCGKTTVTAAILQVLVNHGLHPAAFKCGPDYIDPMFHTAVIGAPSRSLDLYLLKADTVRELLVRNSRASSVSVIEGVMGFYDGVTGKTMTASACDLAMQTQTPAILVIDLHGMSMSAAALIGGYRDFAPNTLRGVLLNGVSEGMYAYYRDIIEQTTGVKVYGHLPRIKEAEIGSRHLGLVTAQEIRDLQQKLAILAQTAEKTIDFEGLLTLAESAPAIDTDDAQTAPLTDQAVRIGIARDRAFCFYYEDGLERLRQMGAELVEFSPLADAALPDGLDGLYLGGGYPELYAETLEQNASMRESVRAAVQHSLPTVAECGGFLYLQQSLDGHAMAGAIGGTAELQQRLQPFGYIELTAEKDTLLCAEGETLRAHTFHYAATDMPGDACTARKPLSRRSWQCVQASDTLFAGFPHLHFCSDSDAAERFVRGCIKYREEKKTMTLLEAINGIVPASQQASAAAHRHQLMQAKPLGGLGILESALERLAGAQHTAQPALRPCAVVVFCADNGVVAQGVTQCGQEVTAQVTENIARGVSTVAIMARQTDMQVIPVDIGVARPVSGPLLAQKNLMRGTKDMTAEPAMTRECCERAIEIGIEIACRQAENGVRVLAGGEMGIGNTTTAAAVIAAFTGASAEQVTGRGAGLSSEGLRLKIAAVDRALARSGARGKDAVTVLHEVGGLDIAGLTGLMLGAAYCRIPVLLDGMITMAAALAATALCPAVRDYLIATHCPSEPGSLLALRKLELTPFIEAGMHLGEGTGAVAGMRLLELALAVYDELPCFEDVEIAPYEELK